MKIERFSSLNESKNDKSLHIITLKLKEDMGFDPEIFIFESEDDAKKFVINTIYNDMLDSGFDIEIIYNILKNYNIRHITDILDGFYTFVNGDFYYNIIYYSYNNENIEKNVKIIPELNRLLNIGPDNVKKVKNYNI